MARKVISILQKCELPECYVCGRQDNMELHHIYKGTANRRLSDMYGCVVYLCLPHHMGTYGVHGKYGHDLDMKLKTECQKAFEEKYTREKFIEVFGRSYL